MNDLAAWVIGVVIVGALVLNLFRQAHGKHRFLLVTMVMFGLITITLRLVVITTSLADSNRWDVVVTALAITSGVIAIAAGIAMIVIEQASRSHKS